MGIEEDKEWFRQKYKRDHEASMDRFHKQQMNEIEKQNRKISGGNNRTGGSGCMLSVLFLLIPIIYLFL